MTSPEPYRSPWLSPDEVAELTAFKTWKRQCLALAHMGIPFRPNRVGRPLVERAAVLVEETRLLRRVRREEAPRPQWEPRVAIELREQQSAASARASKAGKASAAARKKRS